MLRNMGDGHHQHPVGHDHMTLLLLLWMRHRRAGNAHRRGGPAVAAAVQLRGVVLVLYVLRRGVQLCLGEGLRLQLCLSLLGQVGLVGIALGKN